MRLAIGIGPFLGLEVALHGEERALLDGAQVGSAFVLAPGFDIDEGRGALVFLTDLFGVTDGQREASYASGVELTDFSVLTYESGYCEVVLDLFHDDTVLKVKLNFYVAKVTAGWHHADKP